jgi:ADP-ribose pyrophosphatase
MPAMTVLERRLLRKGRAFDITIEKVAFPSGYTIEMEIIRHPGAAAIVALDSADRVIMLRQYRHAVGDTIWEIPAGTLEPDEAPLACARRELVEESGYTAEKWDYLGAITPVPGYADEIIHLYLATDLTACPSNPDPDEIVQVQPLPLSEVVDKILKGQLQDAKTIAAIFHVINRLKQ